MAEVLKRCLEFDGKNDVVLTSLGRVLAQRVQFESLGNISVTFTAQQHAADLYCTCKSRWRGEARCEAKHVSLSLSPLRPHILSGSKVRFLLQAMRANRNALQFDSSSAAVINSSRLCSSECWKLWSDAARERENHRTDCASALLILPPFFSSLFITGIPNGYDCFFFSAQLFFSEPRINKAAAPQMASPR